MHDYHLLYRGIHDEGEVQEWQETFTLKSERGFWAFLWHPDKKFLKSLLDMSQELIMFSINSKDKRQICLSVPYLHILNYITSMNHDKSIRKIQFMILSSSRLYDYTVEFLSSTHPLTNSKQ